MARSIPQALFSLLRLRILLTINVLLFCAVTLSFGREWWHSHLLDREIALLAERKAEVEAEYTALAAASHAHAGEAFVEAEARTKLGLQKPGETLLIIERPQEAWNGVSVPKTEDTRSTSDTTHLSNPAKWWSFFFPRTP